jgi:hypothetical protein
MLWQVPVSCDLWPSCAHRGGTLTAEVQEDLSAGSVRLMAAWETKDIIVVASAVSAFAGTVVVQLLHPLFAARRERAKIVEGIRRELYQKIIAHLDAAINALMVEEGPLVRKAFDALDEARNIFWQHQIDMSEDFRRAGGSILNGGLFEDQFDADRHNTDSVDRTIDELQRTRGKMLATARKELKLRQSLKTTLYSIVNPFVEEVYNLRLKLWLRHWFRKIGLYRILNRFR